MAGRWSSEYLVTEFKDLQASAMAVDCVGTWALLAGRKNLAFVDLNRPSQTVVKVTRQSKWDIGCVQWNQHASHAYRFVIACNQRLDVFDFRDGSASLLCSLKAHSRSVSDIDWSPFDVNIVASCSVDAFTYFWDVRDSKKPVKSFQTVSGASQVKWNKVTNNLFATAHDGDVRIWDPRKGSSPIQYISAHPSKIHGLDWNETNQHNLVTASQDCTIRFWDYNNPRRSEAMINSGNPVWRARYTPFGEGIVSVAVPQLRRGENSLYLWNIKDQQSPVHTFVGHKDVVLEFQWRKQQDGVRDHHLITWSKDQSLRIWKVDRALQKSCGHEIDDFTNGILEEEEEFHSTSSILTSFGSFTPPLEKEPKSTHFSSNLSNESATSMKRAVGGGSISRTASSSQSAQPSSMLPFVSMEQEIDEITRLIPGVRLDQADTAQRTCSFKLSRGQNMVDIELVFPDSYPVKAGPSLTILQSNLDSETLTRLVKIFNDTSARLVKQHIYCLEPCVRQIMLFMEKLGPTGSVQDPSQHHEDRKSMLDKKYIVEKVRTPTSPVAQNNVIPMYPTGSFQDLYIPFPKTCGGTFCSNDNLVVFGVSVAMKRIHEDNEVTPRALSDLVSYAVPQSHSQWMRSQSNSFVTSLLYGSPPQPVSEGISVSSFYTEKTNKNRHHRNSHHHHQKSLSRSHDSIDGRRDKERETERISKRMQKVGCVRVYDISIINPISKFLAENYKLDLSDIPSTCEHNAGVASKIGRRDLVQVWHLIKEMSHPSLQASSNVDQGPPWAFCPFGRPLVNKLLNHYAKMHDVQTLAMICCMFWDKEPPQRCVSALMSTSALPRNESRTSFEYVAANQQYNPYHTVSSMTNLLKGWTSSRGKKGAPAAVMKSKRSQSWSESYDDFKVMEEKDPREKEIERERRQHHNNSKMLDPELKPQHEHMKKAYAEILFKWGLLNERTQVLKYTDSTEADRNTIEFPVVCCNCCEDVRGVQCSRCRYPALRCSICHIGVRGTANLCLACGHGGHTLHMMIWFTSHTVCPTGCGCNCLQENTF
ncbi:hypothetical protein BsWGS_15764 [Bradybaena similaris]